MDLVIGAFTRWRRMCMRLIRHDWRRDNPQRRWLDHWVFGRPEKPELVALHLTWLFTFVLAAFAVMAWLDAKETSEKLQRQVDAAVDANRPWLKPTSAIATFCSSYESPDRYRLHDMILKAFNYGKDPALNVSAASAAEDATYIEDWEQTGECPQKLVPPEENSITDVAIFPSQSEDLTADATYDHSTEKKKVLIGCLFYRYQTSDVGHASKFTTEVETPDNGRLPTAPRTEKKGECVTVRTGDIRIYGVD